MNVVVSVVASTVLMTKDIGCLLVQGNHQHCHVRCITSDFAPLQELMYITVRPRRARDTWTSIGTAAGLLCLVLLGAFLAEIRVERSGDGR